jgi:hypothetical protein
VHNEARASSKGVFPAHAKNGPLTEREHEPIREPEMRTVLRKSTSEESNPHGMAAILSCRPSVKC